MGNTPSKEPQSRPLYKLSKPRVASYQKAAAAVSTLDSRPAVPTSSASEPVPVDEFRSIPYSTTSTSSNFDDVDDSHDSQRNCDKPTPLVAPKAQRRISLFRSKSSQESSDKRTSRRNTIIGSPTLLSNGQFAPVVRANSIAAHPVPDQSHRGLPLPPNEKYAPPVSGLHELFLTSLDCSWPVADTRASWAYDVSSYEAQRILNLVQGQDQPQSIRRSQTSISLADYRPDPMASRRASMFVEPESAPISRSTSEVSLHPPMRRRSMIQTPGVATRPCPTPAPARSTRSSARHSHPPTPSMSRQPSTHFEEPETTSEKHMSLPLLSPSFAVSGDLFSMPNSKDLDYGITGVTGAFKFGTLRITNGSPVLAPAPGPCLDVVLPKSMSTANDYFVVEVQREPGLATDGRESAQTAQPQVLAADSADCVSAGLEGVGEDLPPVSAVPESDRDIERHDLELLLDAEMGQQRPTSVLMTQSRQAAVDDHLFDDDAEVSAPEVLDIRIDLNARSFPLESSDSTQDSERVNRSDSGFVSKSSSSQSRNSLAKADSGYSSNISVRSLRPGKKLSTSEEETARSSADNDRALHKGQRTVMQRQLEIQVPGSSTACEDRLVGTPQSDKAPALPPKDDFLLAKMSQTPRDTDNTRAISSTPGTKRGEVSHHQPPVIDISQYVEGQKLASPKALPLTPTSATSDGSSSSLTIGNNVQKPGRLQRFLSLKTSPFSKQPYTVHVTHSVDNKIPSIPKDVEAKLRARTGLYPMTTKRLALKSQMSKDTLKTILSVGSLEYANDEYLPPTPTILDREEEEDKISEASDAKENTLKHTFSSMQSNFKTAAASMLPHRKQITRKPIPARGTQQTGSEITGREETMLPLEEHVTDYLSINSALGSNAYDSATRALAPSTRPSRTRSMTTYHDHYSQSRTYSLPSTDVPAITSTSSIIRSDAEIPPKRKTSPPISMITRTGFREPPPRSPVSPQGPAVLPRKSHEKSSRPMSHSAALAAGHRLGRVPGGSRPRRSASTSQAQWGLPNRHNSLASQPPPFVHSRHNSISSVSSDIVRDKWLYETYGQHTTAVTLKHRSSVDNLDRRSSRGGHLPQPAHQGPTPDDCSLPRHRNWSTPTSPSMSGSHQLWAGPPHVPRGQHYRNLSAGSSPHYPHSPHAGGGQPPYRILHSYNSPAYRNAPIWG